MNPNPSGNTESYRAGVFLLRFHPWPSQVCTQPAWLCFHCCRFKCHVNTVKQENKPKKSWSYFTSRKQLQRTCWAFLKSKVVVILVLTGLMVLPSYGAGSTHLKQITNMESNTCTLLILQMFKAAHIPHNISFAAVSQPFLCLTQVYLREVSTQLLHWKDQFWA